MVGCFLRERSFRLFSDIYKKKNVGNKVRDGFYGNVPFLATIWVMWREKNSKILITNIRWGMVFGFLLLIQFQ